MARSEYRCCPAPPAAPAGCPGGDRLRCQPQRHIAASHESLIVGRPVRNAVLRLVRGMDLRLHLPSLVWPRAVSQEVRATPPHPRKVFMRQRPAPAGCPGGDRLRCQPQRHLAASNESLIIGRPVCNAVLRLVRGMDLRLHPRSVASVECPEKFGPSRPTRAGSSCNNAQLRLASPRPE